MNNELMILTILEKMKSQIDSIHKATELNFMMHRKVLSLLGYVLDYDNKGDVYLWPRGGKRRKIK